MREVERRAGAPRAVGSPHGRRWATIVVAFAVAAAGFAFAVQAFRVPPGPDRTSTGTVAPKANGAIYFRVGGGDGPSWIDAVEPDGSNRRTVFDGSMRIAQIAWSPDGSKIAYQDPILDERGIFVANADGTDPVRLTRGVNDGWPSWSPDGTTIVFSSSRADPSVGPCTPGEYFRCPTDIYAIGVDGSDLRRLTTDPAPEYQPVWSPDGSAIAFVRTVRGMTDAEIFEAPRIFAMDPDGTDVRQVSSGEGGSDFSPGWSPDGTRLVFVAIRFEDWGIWTVDADGSQERMILGGVGAWSAYEAEWSPDGELIVFVGDPIGNSSAGDYPPDDALYVMRPDGSDVRLLADAPRFGVAGDIAWRPLPTESSPARSPAEPATVEVEVSTTEGVAEFPSAVAVGEGGVWVAAPKQDGSGEGEVVRLDPATGEAVARIEVGAAPGWEFGGAGLAIGAGSVWTVGTVRAEDGGCCDALATRIDPGMEAVVDEFRVPGMHGGDLWVEGGTMFVLGFQAEGPALELVRMDPTTHSVLWRVPVPGQWSQTVFAAGGSVWVLGTAPDARGAIEVTTLYRFDPATGALIDEASIGADTLAPAVDGDTVWLRVEGGVQRFDARTGELVGEPIGPDAGCCTGPFVPDGAGGVWVVSTPSNGRERSIWRVDATGTVVAMGTIEDPATFEAMHGQSYAFDPQTQAIWVQHYRDSVSRVRVVTAGA